MTVKWIDKGTYLVTEDGVWSEQSSGILKEQALDSLSSDVVKYWRPDGVIVMVPPVMGATKGQYRLYSGVEEVELGHYDSLGLAIDHFHTSRGFKE